MKEDVLTTSRSIELTIQKERGNYNDEIQEYVNVQNAVEVFANIFFKKIQDLYKTSSERGFTHKFSPSHIIKKDFYGNEIVTEYTALKNSKKPKFYTLMSYEIAGRIMVTLRDEQTEEFITLLGAADENNGAGLQGIGCAYKNALYMLDMFTTNGHYILKNMKTNKELSIL